MEESFQLILRSSQIQSYSKLEKTYWRYKKYFIRFITLSYKIPLNFKVTIVVAKDICSPKIVAIMQRFFMFIYFSNKYLPQWSKFKESI